MTDAAEELLNLSQKELDRLPAEMREKIEAVRKQVLAARRLSTLKSAKDSLLDFVQMSMPDPRHPDDTDKSRYQVHEVHQFLAEKLEQVERGEVLRLCLSVQPRVGKSELVSKKFPAWMMGRDPYKQIILAGYGDEFVKEFGREVRNTMLSPFYQQVFPGAQLHRNAKAANRQQTTAGGILTFAGLGGQLTGKGADCVLPYCTVLSKEGIAPIEDVKVGDEIYGYDHAENRGTWTRVRAVSAKRTEKRLVALGGLHCTEDHRVFTSERGYVEAVEAGRLPGLSWDESLPRAGVPGVSKGPPSVLDRPDLRPVRQGVSADPVRTRKGDSPVRGQSEDVLWESVLSAMAGGESCPEEGTRRVRRMWGPSDREGAEKILRSEVLPTATGEAPLKRGIFREVSSLEAPGGREGSGVPAVRDGAEPDGRASHRPRPDAECDGKSDFTVSAVSQEVSHVPGACAADLKGVLRGPGEYVVDIQTGTGNFFCEGALVHNCLIIDDPIKNAEEARSKATKDKLWEGFTRDAMSRLMGKAGAVVITATRWAEDDLIGRLTDPDLGYTTAEDAAQWEVINIPALIETPQDKEEDPFNRDYGEVLWEERTPRAFLESFRRLDSAGFSALYQGRPSPPEGNFFRRDDIVPHVYKSPDELPRNLRYYAASDHAVSIQQNRDSTCMGPVGVDEQGDIWFLPDLVWAQLPADDQVEAMLRLMQEYKLMAWWAEKGHISQSIGPFLRKRMQEESTYCSIIEKTPVKDKQTRAQAIQARMSMGRVHLPQFAPWFQDALEQMLNFPNGAHDDFCVAEGSQVAMADGREVSIENVRIGDYVKTPKGPRRVAGAACTDSRAEVYRVQFSDGSRLDATGNHPVATESGFVRVDRLPLSGMVYSCETQQEKVLCNEGHPKQTLSNTGGTDTADTPKADTCTTAGITTGRSPGGVSSTVTYGKTLTALFRRVTTFITETMTRLTTPSETCGASLWQSIEESTCANVAQRRSNGRIWSAFGRWPQSGTGPKKAGDGILGWCGRLGTNVSGMRFSAATAGCRSRRYSLVEPSSVATGVVIRLGTRSIIRRWFRQAPQNRVKSVASSSGIGKEASVSAHTGAGKKRVISVERLPGRSPVYNLTVEGEHVYFVNGTLTHNCDFISWIGIGLAQQVGAQRTVEPPSKEPPSGSLEWILKTSERIRKENTAAEAYDHYLH